MNAQEYADKAWESAQVFLGNGTYFPEPEEEEDVEELSFQELQELVRSLAKRVAELEQHHAKF